MKRTVRAIYENGKLRLLEPVSLDQNQEVEVTVTADTTEKKPGNAQLMELFGSISHEDAREMTEAIEEAFEQARADNWR